MYVVEIIGRKRVSFVGQDGKTVEGMSFYYSMPFSENADGCEGVRAGTFFLSARALGAVHYLPAVGDQVDLQFNPYGKVNDCRLADE